VEEAQRSWGLSAAPDPIRNSDRAWPVNPPARLPGPSATGVPTPVAAVWPSVALT